MLCGITSKDSCAFGSFKKHATDTGFPRRPNDGGKNRILGIVLLSIFFVAPFSIRPAAAEEPLPPEKDETLEEVRQKIAEKGYRWKAGPTSRSDWSWERLQRTLTLNPPDDMDQYPRIDPSISMKNADDLPIRFDWRDHEGTTPAKNQGDCGSCWAFASIGALEGCARIHDGLIYDLSEQQMLSCNDSGYGCDGGWMNSCYRLFMDPGAMTEEDIPYVATELAACFQNHFEPQAKISNWFYLSQSTRAMKAAIYEYGPIVVAMMVHSDFRYYQGDCYEHASVGDVNHAVIIVGWDDYVCGDHGAWICKNSWSEGWGENGFFYIGYHSADIGERAAAIVHIPLPRVHILHVPVDSRPESGFDFEISADIMSKVSTVCPDSVFMSYRINGGGFETFLLAGTETPGVYSGAIPAQPLLTTIDYYLSATDHDGNHVCSPLLAPDEYYSFDVVKWRDNFEDDSDAWVVGGSEDDATKGIWERVEPIGTAFQPGEDHTHSGTQCWITGQHIPGEDDAFNDVDFGQTTLTSPMYNLRGSKTARAKYFRWFTNHLGANPYEDYWVVQARNNGGAWVDIENINISTAEWVLVDSDLIEKFGHALGDVQFRFIASDRGPGSAVEAAIDDFAIFADPDTTTTWALNGQDYRMSLASPNPLHVQTIFKLQIERPIAGSIQVYGVDGRLIRNLFQGEFSPGSLEIPWDGRDENGNRVRPGVYLYRVDIGEDRNQGRIVVIR
ncbi:MAG: hypothetical protein KJ970_06920 [Candidatus Eisenbacteria bacterium]|uniref:Peptidase C1A papain C-terminal domain-containing protein n=1 Tax=Eiseniibacteriota bacterium TaxID=2212470 RepID=A0A948RVB8_UNCEI|nr:hypothetical protein [Candidatus Eisenbacteria bacterium]MBU1947997.1 hypothetical protein [Candidatus Eisenbacteria bacterium]MBU2690646.1 hypothetical protein [Candidatus Eisenbacteria bacterium]